MNDLRNSAPGTDSISTQIGSDLFCEGKQVGRWSFTLDSNKPEMLRMEVSLQPTQTSQLPSQSRSELDRDSVEQIAEWLRSVLGAMPDS